MLSHYIERKRRENENRDSKPKNKNTDAEPVTKGPMAGLSAVQPYPNIRK